SALRAEHDRGRRLPGCAEHGAGHGGADEAGGGLHGGTVLSQLRPSGGAGPEPGRGDGGQERRVMRGWRPAGCREEPGRLNLEPCDNSEAPEPCDTRVRDHSLHPTGGRAVTSRELTARDRFAAMVLKPEPDLDLAAAALQIAAEEYPQLVAGPYLQRLDLLAERVRDRLDNETAPLVVLQELNRVLFEEERFRGNAEAYYDPRNSFLNDVLDRRVGIPISLSLVYLEVGWRLGLPLSGVGFPGHFLVRYEGEVVRVLLDPFDGGRLRFEDQAQELLD